MELGVLHPWLLALALAAILPWWLSRRRAQPETISWGASRWLAAAASRFLPAQARQRRWTLWLRVLILLWLALALAIPKSFVAHAPSSSAPQARTWWIVILDDGPSSTALQNQETILSLSLKQAQDLSAQMASVDGLSAIGTSLPTTWKISGPEGEPTSRTTVFTQWSSTPFTHDGFAALRSVRDRIQTQQSFGRKFDRIEIVIWSSAHSPSWRSAAEPSNQSLLSDIEKVASLRWYDVGDARANNLAIVKVAPAPNRVVPQKRQSLSVTLRNQDQSRTLNRRLRWLLDDESIGSQLITLAANETKDVSIELPPLAPGEYRFQLQAEDDPLPVDSNWWSVIQADDRLPLSLEGDDSRSRSILIEWAEALRRSGRGTWVSAEDAADAKSTRPLLLVFGKSQTEPSCLAKIRYHLATGGVVILWCDAGMNPGEWLTALEISTPDWQPSEPTWQRVILTGQRPESLRVFEGSALATLASTPIWRSWVPQSPPDRAWTTWLSLEPTDSVPERNLPARPLVLVRDLEQGQLVVITSAIGDATSTALAATDSPPDAWSAWAIWPSFPPFLEQLFNTLAVRETGQQHRFELAQFNNLARNGLSSDWQPITLAPSAPLASDSTLSPTARSMPFWPGLYRHTTEERETLEAWNLVSGSTTPTESVSFASWIQGPWESIEVPAAAMTAPDSDPLPILCGILLGLLLLETWVSEHRPNSVRRRSRQQAELSLGSHEAQR